MFRFHRLRFVICLPIVVDRSLPACDLMLSISDRVIMYSTMSSCPVIENGSHEPLPVILPVLRTRVDPGSRKVTCTACTHDANHSYHS